MKVAVTGGAGFFAKYVISELTTHGHEVVAIDIRSNPRVTEGVRNVQADVTRLNEISAALEGSEAVVHLAGIPHPLERSADEVYHTNAAGAFTTSWAAGQLGISRFILASSESVLGNAFHPAEFTPDSFPIDENHPLLPLDPYGISKIAAEQAVERSAVRWGFSSIALRMPWIWGVDQADRGDLYRTLRSDYILWKKNLWAFVDARDAARAARLSLKLEARPYTQTAYFITADKNWVAPERTTQSLVDEFYPSVHRTPDPDRYASLISNIKAKAELGWSPEYSAEELLQIPE